MFYTTTLLFTLASSQLISGQDRFFPLMTFADPGGQQLSEELVCEDTIQFDPTFWDCQEVQQVDLSEFECWEETDFDQLFDCNEDLSQNFECTEETSSGSMTINPTTPTGSGAVITPSNVVPSSGTVNQQSPSVSGSSIPSSAFERTHIVSLLMALAMAL